MKCRRLEFLNCAVAALTCSKNAPVIKTPPGGLDMPGYRKHGRAQILVDLILARKRITSADLIARVGGTVTSLHRSLAARKDKEGCVTKDGRFWRPFSRVRPCERATTCAEPLSHPANGEQPALVQSRTRPPFREWSGTIGAGPIRPSALDFLRIPSRIGDQRIDYLANPAPGGAKALVRKALAPRNSRA